MAETDLPFPIGSKDYLDALKMGYYGLAASWLLCVLNVLYYGQILYTRTIASEYGYWGRGWTTWMGAAMTMRTLMNVVIYWLLSMFVMLTVFDNTMIYQVMWYAAWAAGFAYALRTVLVLFMMLFGLMLDDYSYYNDDATLMFYKNQIAWGPKMSTWVGQDDEFMMLDIQFEAANLVVGMMAGAFYEVGMTIWRPLAAQGYSKVPYKKSEAKAATAAKEAAQPEEATPADDEDGF